MLVKGATGNKIIQDVVKPWVRNENIICKIAYDEDVHEINMYQ